MYITEADVNTFLDITGETTLINQLIASAEAVFNAIINAPSGLWSADYTNYFDHQIIPNWPQEYGDIARVFYLKSYKPTAIKKIDGVSAGTINVDYIIEGQKLTLKTALSYPSAFPYRHSIEYTAGLSSTPDDIKHACLMLVSALYNTRKSNGIGSFRQDLLSVNYNGQSSLDSLLDPETANSIRLISRKYLVPFALS